MTLQEEIQRNNTSATFLTLDAPTGGPKQKPEAQNAVDVIHEVSHLRQRQKVEKDEECYRGQNRIYSAV